MSELTPERLDELEVRLNKPSVGKWASFKTPEARALIAAARERDHANKMHERVAKANEQLGDANMALTAENAALREAGEELLTMSGVAAMPLSGDDRLPTARVKMDEALALKRGAS